MLGAVTVSPYAKLVTADPKRRELSRGEIVDEHFATSGLPRGHGFTQANRDADTAYYSFDKGRFRFVVMDTVNPNGYADGSLDPDQFAWLKSTIEAAKGKAVLVFSHHTSASMSNPFVATGGDPRPRVLGGEVTDYLLGQQRVIAWVNGHTHRNEVTAHARSDGSGGFWEINTASHIDYPQQSRLVEVADNGDGTLSIFTTILDHAGPPTTARTSPARSRWPACRASSPTTTPTAPPPPPASPRTATPSCWSASRRTSEAAGLPGRPGKPSPEGGTTPLQRRFCPSAPRFVRQGTDQSAETWSRNVSRLLCRCQIRSARTSGSFSSSPSMIRPPMISWPT